MRPILVVCVACCSIAAAMTEAATPPGELATPARLPAIVAASLKNLDNNWREVGGNTLNGAAVTRVALNADGREDFVVDAGSADCDGAASIYGDLEKGIAVYVDDGMGGATENFCDRALVWNAQSNKFEYAPVATVRMPK